MPEFQWAVQCGNPPNSTDTKTRLASIPDGSYFMSGEFLDTAQFGTKTLVSAGGTDVFLVKYSADDDPLWSVKMGGQDYDYVQQIIADDDGNVIIAGYFYGTTQIGTDEYASYGSQDLFIAKYNSDGDFIWSARSGGPMADYLNGLTAGDSQDFYIAGFYYNSIAIGDTTLLSSGGSDIYLAKYSTDGEYLWANSCGGSSSDQVNSASFNANGNILVAGSFYYNISFSDTTLTTTNPVGVYIAGFHPDGQLNWVLQLDGTYLTTEVLIKSAPSCDFYISGNFSEQITFGDKVFDAGEFNQDIYLAKYDSTGDLQWARHAHSFASDQVVGLETDQYNNLYIAGHYLDTIHFDQLTLKYNLCCGSREIFVVYYTDKGNALWGDSISGTRANLQSIELQQDNELLISGLFSEIITMGNYSLSYYDGFQNYMTCLKGEVYTLVNDNGPENELMVFPNPASHMIQVMNSDNVHLIFQIYSINGSLLKTGSLPESGGIDISDLQPGQYIFRCSNNNNQGSCSNLFIKK